MTGVKTAAEDRGFIKTGINGILDNTTAQLADAAAQAEAAAASALVYDENGVLIPSFGKRRVKRRRRKSKRNTRFGNHGNVKIENAMGPYPAMFGSYDPYLI